MSKQADDHFYARYPFRVYVMVDHFKIVFPDLPGAMTAATTWDDIGPMARDLLKSWLGAAISEKLPIPPPTTGDPDSPMSKRYSVEDVAFYYQITPRRVRAIAASRGVGKRFADVLIFDADDIEKLRPRPPGRPRQSEESPNQ